MVVGPAEPALPAAAQGAAEKEGEEDEYGLTAVANVLHGDAIRDYEAVPVARFPRFAFFLLRDDQFPRRQCIDLISRWWFDPVILALIGINCLTMALFASPLVKNIVQSECGGVNAFPAGVTVHGFTTCDELVSARSQWAREHWTYGVLKAQPGCSLDDPKPCSISQMIDFVFLIIFTIEMIVKMLASGLIMGPNAYLRSSWNWLDFIVVCVGYIEMFATGLPGIKVIRLVKALRPLRTLQRVRGLRVLVQTILAALPQMCNVAVFLVFTLLIFGLFGHAFFAGRLRHTCHDCVAFDPISGECTGWESTGDNCDAECEWNDDGTLKGFCAALGNRTYQLQNDKHVGVWSYSCREGQRCLCTSQDKTRVRVAPEWGVSSTASSVEIQMSTPSGWTAMDPMDPTDDFAALAASASPVIGSEPSFGFPIAGVDTGHCDWQSNPNCTPRGEEGAEGSRSTRPFSLTVARSRTHQMPCDAELPPPDALRCGAAPTRCPAMRSCPRPSCDSDTCPRPLATRPLARESRASCCMRCSLRLPPLPLCPTVTPEARFSTTHDRKLSSLGASSLPSATLGAPRRHHQLRLAAVGDGLSLPGNLSRGVGGHDVPADGRRQRMGGHLLHPPRHIRRHHRDEPLPW